MKKNAAKNKHDPSVIELLKEDGRNTITKFPSQVSLDEMYNMPVESSKEMFTGLEENTSLPSQDEKFMKTSIVSNVVALLALD
jgi:hypothetical protein